MCYPLSEVADVLIGANGPTIKGVFETVSAICIPNECTIQYVPNLKPRSVAESLPLCYVGLGNRVD